MRIAQISPLAESVPPKLYGGTERVVSYLTEELVAQGHQVTLFASGDSKTAATLRPQCPQALRLDPSVKDPLAHHMIMLDDVMRHAHLFDLLHFHIDVIHLPLIRPIMGKTLTTLHGRLDMLDLQPVYKVFSDVPLISISDSQRAPMPPVNWIDTVYHGLPEDLYTMNEGPRDYLAFLGRISEEKRPDRAIEIAIKAGIKLKMAAKVDKADALYFQNVIKPMLDHPLIEFIGEINDKDKGAFLGNAKALLFPIDWPEPFGITMIEGMACGTPVIAFNCGSVPEVIDEGVTGRIVDSVDEAVVALGELDRFTPQMIRKRFEERFSARRMAEDYLSIYNKLVYKGSETRRLKDLLFA